MKANAAEIAKTYGFGRIASGIFMARINNESCFIAGGRGNGWLAMVGQREIGTFSTKTAAMLTCAGEVGAIN